MRFSLILLLSLTGPLTSWAGPSISPSLFFSRQHLTVSSLQKPATNSSGKVPVTLRFDSAPSPVLIDSIEARGAEFYRLDGEILHSRRIYPAFIDPASLERLSEFGEIVRIEDSRRPIKATTLDVSNPQVQASLVWGLSHNGGPVDGTGVTVVNVDTGIDIYHPAFFKPDGGAFTWIDVNRNGRFDSGTDAVDLNGNGSAESRETLRFYDALCSDTLNLISRNIGVYDADLDWLYCDANGNSVRDYGPELGYGETDPCFGEQLFVITDLDHSNRLDPGEPLTGLSTSRVIAIFDKYGAHYRGQSLLTNSGDTINHGTGSSGIVGGNLPGRRLTGMAPGVEFIHINHTELESIESAILQACTLGGDIFMYEYGSWVFEFLDGSSNLETMIDDLYADGFHQITASGNLAGPTRKRHAFVSIPKSGSDTVSLTVPNIGITQLYLSIVWRTGTRPAFTLHLPDYEAPLSGDNVKRTYGPCTVISGFEKSPAGTSKLDVMVYSDSRFTGQFTVDIVNQSRYDCDTHFYLADNVTQWMNGAQFTSHVTDDGTVCTPGTAKRGITVGAYDPRGTRNTAGDINDFSSWGKTVDGRRAVEITAPGTLVYSLVSTSLSKKIPGGYFEFGGTSAALPHVVGCAALLLQMSPGISPDSLSNALIHHAGTDSFTGTVPNDIWGYGKIRIYNVFKDLKLLPPVSVNDTPFPFIVSQPYPNPFNASVSFRVTVPDPTQALSFSVYNILGQRVFRKEMRALNQQTVSWNGLSSDGEILSSGMYFARFDCGKHSEIRKLTLMK